MRSRQLAATLVLAGVAACSSSSDGGVSANCVPSITNPCTNPIDTTGTGGQTNVTTGFVVKTLADGGTTYGYQVFVPASYNASTAKVPVILFMHGSGEKGSDNVNQTNVGLGPVVKASLSTFPAIVVFPQGPSGEGSATNETFDRIAVEALDKTMSEYGKADPSRVYLTGLSYGGIRGYEVAFRNPTKFAAWVPISAAICGACLSPGATQQQGIALAAQTLKSVPIWQFHGQLDTQINVSNARDIEAAFKANGDPYQLTVYPNGDHGIWDAVYARADMWTWLYTQKR